VFAPAITGLRKVQKEKSNVELGRMLFHDEKGIVLGHVISDKVIEADKRYDFQPSAVSYGERD